MDIFKSLVAVFVIFVIFVFVFSFIWSTGLFMYGIFVLDPFCLSHGYREGSVTVFYDAYCVKRIDQTDMVVPKKDIK